MRSSVITKSFFHQYAKLMSNGSVMHNCKFYTNACLYYIVYVHITVRVPRHAKVA